MDDIDKNLEKLMEEVHKIGMDTPEKAESSEKSVEAEGEIVDMVPVDNSQNPPVKPIETDEDPSEAVVNDEVITSMKDLISQGISTIKTIKPSIEASIDWKELTAYSGLIKSTSDAIGVLNKLNIEMKKNRTAKKLKEMDINKKKSNVSQTAIFIGSREDAIKQLKSPPKQIEGEVIENVDEDSSTES